MNRNAQPAVLSKEEMDKIIDIILEKGNLSTKDLRNVGISEYRLKKLCHEGVLKRVKVGFYLPTSMVELYSKAKSYFDEGSYKEARVLFKVCKEIESASKEVNFYLFYLDIVIKDFSNILDYLDILKGVTDDAQKRDFAFYLYLLSFIIDLPDSYKEQVFRMTPRDFRIDGSDKRFPYPRLSNSIRLNAYKQKFSYTLKSLDRTSEERGQNMIESLTRLLVSNARFYQKVTTSQMFGSLDDDNLECALSILKKEENMHPLSKYYISVKHLLEDILEMKKTGIVLTATISSSQTVNELVYHRDYRQAMIVNAENAKKRSINPNLTILGRLLHYAEDYRNSLIAGENVSQKTPVIEPERDLLSEMLSVLLINGENGKNEALELLRQYLTNTGLSEFAYLIENLILISLEAGDTSFMNPMMTIASLRSGEYRVDVNKYIEELEYSIDNGYLKEARMYLTIIEESYKKGHTDVDISELASILEPLQSRLKEKEKLEKENGQFTIKPVENDN